MNIFGIGLPEMAVIAAIALVVFGPKRLPELGRTLGRTLKSFQSASQDFEQEFRGAMAASRDSEPPASNVSTAVEANQTTSATAESPSVTQVTPPA